MPSSGGKPISKAKLVTWKNNWGYVILAISQQGTDSFSIYPKCLNALQNASDFQGDSAEEFKMWNN